MPVLVLILHEALVLLLIPVRLVATYVYGIWFLVRHPHQFRDFAIEYRRFRTQIRQADELAVTGYYDFNRAQRRKAMKLARKK